MKYDRENRNISKGKSTCLFAKNRSVRSLEIDKKRIVAISTPFPGDYEVTSGHLSINAGGLTNVAIYDIVKFDIISSKSAGIIYGNGIDYNDTPVSPQPIFINGGEKLILTTRDAPNAALNLTLLTRKRSQ